MMIDSDEAIKRMQDVIEHYKKYGYMEEAMYRMAVGHCIAVVREMMCSKRVKHSLLCLVMTTKNGENSDRKFYARTQVGGTTMAQIKKSTTRRIPSGLVEQIQSCHNAACADIEKQRIKAKAWKDLQNTRHNSRWRAGTCLICGEYMEYCITNYHAKLHGYKSAEELIRAGKICFE